MKPLNNLEIAEFCNQIGIMLHAGISSLEALNLLLEDSENEEEQVLLKQMIEAMETHGYFYEAIASVSVFPDYVLHMVKLGEETGTLDQTMDALSNHYTREENIAGMIKSALLYPMIMLGMMFLIILVLITKVMPIFRQVFIQLGQEMTGFSAGLLSIGELLSTYSIVFVIVLVLLVFLFYKFRDRMPFQKKIQADIAVCRFTDGMSIALKSGLTPEASLELAEKLVSNSELTSKIDTCKDLVASGTDLHDALKETSILTGVYARMAYIAGKAGNLDDVMEQISSEYEHAANKRIHSLLGVLEPSLVIILSLIVGIILFSVMLPLLGVMSTL